MNNWITRKNTKLVDVGGVLVGNNNPISVQSMTNTNTCDVISTINQINDLTIELGRGQGIKRQRRATYKRGKKGKNTRKRRL